MEQRQDVIERNFLFMSSTNAVFTTAHEMTLRMMMTMKMMRTGSMLKVT